MDIRDGIAGLEHVVQLLIERSRTEAGCAVLRNACQIQIGLSQQAFGGRTWCLSRAIIELACIQERAIGGSAILRNGIAKTLCQVCREFRSVGQAFARRTPGEAISGRPVTQVHPSAQKRYNSPTQEGVDHIRNVPFHCRTML